MRTKSKPSTKAPRCSNKQCVTKSISGPFEERTGGPNHRHYCQTVSTSDNCLLLKIFNGGGLRAKQVASRLQRYQQQWLVNKKAPHLKKFDAVSTCKDLPTAIIIIDHSSCELIACTSITAAGWWCWLLLIAWYLNLCQEDGDLLMWGHHHHGTISAPS